MVRCKFKVTRITQYNVEGKEIILNPVQGEPFGKYTPCGEIKMMINNLDSANQFGIGKEYYVDFSPAE